MKKFLRGTQLVKQRAGVSEGTHDESYDQLEKELTKLQKTAKEMPKAVAGIAEGMKNMWKQYHKMTTELQKVSQQLELSPLCNEMSARLEVIGNEFDSEKLEKLQNDLNSSAIEVLRKLESDIKSLETVRNERSNRRLEYDAAKEKSQKKEAELMKKGKDVESDSTMTARRIEVETACKAYEVSNQRSIEEMTKVSSVKDDVFKMTAYNVASFVGAYLQASGEQMLAVKSSYEQAQVGGTVYAAPAAAAAATAAAPTVDAAAAAASAAPAADTPSPPADAAARSTPEAAAAAPAAAAASAVEAAAPASQPVAATRPPGLAPPTAEEEAAVTAAVVGETPTKGPSSTDSPAEPAGSPAALGTLPPPLDDSSAAITRLPSTEVPVAAAAAQPAAAVSGVMAYAAEADVTDLPVTAPVEEPQPSTTDAAAAAAVAAAPADEATPAPEPVAAPEADAAPAAAAAAAAAADATAAEEPAAAAPTVQPTPDETPADVAAPAPEAQVAADADADAGAAPTPAEVPSASSVDAAPATDAAAAPTTEVPVEEPVVNSADAE